MCTSSNKENRGADGEEASGTGSEESSGGTPVPGQPEAAIIITAHKTRPNGVAFLITQGVAHPHCRKKCASWRTGPWTRSGIGCGLLRSYPQFSDVHAGPERKLEYLPRTTVQPPADI
jgi:hypothetical protein